MGLVGTVSWGKLFEGRSPPREWSGTNVMTCDTNTGAQCFKVA